MSDFDIFKDLGITAEDMQKFEAREKELAGTRKPTEKYELAIAVEAAIEKLAENVGGYVINEHEDSLAFVRQLKVESAAVFGNKSLPLLRVILTNVDSFSVEVDDLDSELIVLHFIIRDVFTYDESAN